MPRSISPRLLRFFHGIAFSRLRSSFRAVRVAHADRAVAVRDADLVIALNHPSWWDPLVGFVLARYLFPGRNFYAPMDEDALRRYGIFRRLGMFPVAVNSARGAAQFLRAASAVLEHGDALAITPQGHFTDIRVRPVALRPGLAALLHRRAAQGRATTVLPIALEYTFWDQRLPEVLVNCGEAVLFPADVAGEGALSQPEMHHALERGMLQAQDELAELSLRRDPGAFASLLDGGQGSAGFYGWIERVRSLLGGDARRGDHQASPPTAEITADSTAENGGARSSNP